MDTSTSKIEFCTEERRGLTQVVFGELMNMLLNCSSKLFISRLLELESVVKTWSCVTTIENDVVELEPNGDKEMEPRLDQHEEHVLQSADQTPAIESTSSTILDDKHIMPGPISKRLLPKSVKLVLNALSRPQKSLRCMICNEEFPTSKTLRLHIAENHLSNGRWRRSRDESLKFCAPNVTSAGRRRRSAVASRRSVPVCFNCTICGKKVSTAGSLKRHMVDIHGEDRRQYTCEVCGVSLTSASSLSRHKLQLHLETRKHACSECGREFALKQTLVQHINGVHLKYRPHLCPLCGDRFLKRDNLRNHTRLVHRDKFNQQ